MLQVRAVLSLVSMVQALQRRTCEADVMCPPNVRSEAQRQSEERREAKVSEGEARERRGDRNVCGGVVS